MRPAMSVVSLLLLLLLLVETPQGIRLKEESFVAFRKIVHKDSIDREGRAVTAAAAAAAAEGWCKDDEPCSGKARKLMTKAMPMPTSKSEPSSEKKAKAAHHHSTGETDRSRRPDGCHVKPPETCTDVLDIAGMDYTPARRKPPIHN